MAHPSGIGAGEGEEEKIQSETRQDASNNEEHNSEKDLRRENGYTQIDPALASRIAANVDDFMVSFFQCVRITDMSSVDLI